MKIYKINVQISILAKKLFTEYIGLGFGDELNINITSPSILDMYQLAKLIKKSGYFWWRV